MMSYIYIKLRSWMLSKIVTFGAWPRIRLSERFKLPGRDFVPNHGSGYMEFGIMGPPGSRKKLWTLSSQKRPHVVESA